jgi:hypothetical protein
MRRERAADPEQRALGAREQRREALEILGQRPGRDARAHLRDRRVGLVVEEILGQDDGDRTGRAALGEMKGAGERLARGLRLVDLDHRLRHVGEEAAVMLLLQRHAAEIGALDLADQGNEGRCVVIGRVQRDERVREAGAA